MTEDKAMLLARQLVEDHISVWGMVPHPDHLKARIAQELFVASRTKVRLVKRQPFVFRDELEA